MAVAARSDPFSRTLRSLRLALRVLTAKDTKGAKTSPRVQVETPVPPVLGKETAAGVVPVSRFFLSKALSNQHSAFSHWSFDLRSSFEGLIADC